MITKEQFQQLMQDAMKGAAPDMATAIRGAMDEAFKGHFPIPGPTHAKSAGEQAIEQYQAIKNFLDTGGVSAPITLDLPGYSLKPGERLAPYGKAGEVISTDYARPSTTLPIKEPPKVALRLRDVIPVVGATTPSIQYTRITNLSENAAGVAELGPKPASQIVAEPISDTADTVATYLPVSRQSLQDVAQLRNFIDSALMHFLALREEADILTGGGGASFTGILNTVGIQTQALSTHIPDTVRKAMTKLQLQGFQPTAIVLHPNDWEQAELIKDGVNGGYLLTPRDRTVREAQTPASLWGVPVIPSVKMTEGTGLVGAFDIGCALFMWENPVIRVFEQHSDWAIKNLLAVLAEFRAIFAVFFPQAFVELTGI